MAPAGPLPPVGGLPGGLPLRRCACSGQKSGMRRTFAPLRSPFRPRPLGSLVGRRWARPGLAPGSAGRSPSGPPPAPWLRLSGAAPPALRGPSGPPPSSLRLRLRPPAARPRSLRPGCCGSPSARCGLPGRSPWLCSGSPGPRGLLAAPGPPGGPGLRPAALRLPSGLRPGASGGPGGPLSPAPGPGPSLGFWGVPPLRRRARGPRSGCGPLACCAWSFPCAAPWPGPGPFRAVDKERKNRQCSWWT